MDEKKVRQLAAVMFTDIVGYTAMMEKDEQMAEKVRERHREVFRQQHGLFKGEILQYYGDGTLSVFKSAIQAVKCAIALQKLLQEDIPVPVRMGLHMGDIVFSDTEVYGDGVNLASRIENMGVAGAVLISGKLNDELQNQSDLHTKSLGHFSLKNIAKPVELFAITNQGIKIPKSSELKGKQKEQTKSIAVLPFLNLSSDEDNEYFSDGMTEEIINALAKIKGLKVTSRTSSFFFKNKNISIPQIGKELNVSAILEGSIRLSGNMMRITAQLIDVADDFHFWSETFDRSMENIFAVQDEISLLIADRLREHLGHFEIEDHLVDTQEIRIENYKKYLQGRYHVLKMRKADIEKGISILEEVIESQPDFALAYIGVHLGYTLMGSIGLSPAQEAFGAAQPYLEKAIELDPNLTECQLNLSYISFLQDWDLAATYRHLNKALEIRPTVEYYQSMASVLVAEGKYTAALNYIDTALQIDPLSEINFHLKGFIFYCQEKYKRAIKFFEKSVNLNGNLAFSALYWGQALILMGRPEESLEFFEKLPADQSGDFMKSGGLILAHAALGNTEKAYAGIEKLESSLESELTERVITFLILSHALLGNKEKCLHFLEKAISFRLPMMVYTKMEPILKPLRNESRFKALMSQVLDTTNDEEESERKYKRSLLNKELLDTHKQDLEQLMETKKPYLDPNLTLRGLAEILEIPPNHLSQLLNEGFDKNFAEYVNSYRIETFKAKAADPSQQHLTILALAYDSGFNSKTVFNTFFKKMTGRTPSQYWKEVVK